MLKQTVFKLHFTGPLHIGKGLGEAYDTTDSLLHSDTISGFITSLFCLQNNGDEVLDFMQSYRVSSAFPFYRSNYFLPLPVSAMEMLNVLDTEKPKAGKMIKKIEYVPLNGWKKLATGQALDVKKEKLSPCGKILFPEDVEAVSVFKDNLEQRVSVSRDGESDAVPFYFEKRYFVKDGGLYFFCEASPEVTDRIEEILMFGQGIGIGTDKSVGNGQYEVTRDTIEMEWTTEEADRYQLISLYCPQKEELINVEMEKNDYQLVKRGGFIAGTTLDKFRHLRKKSVYMFTEGSIFRSHKPIGKIENVRPQWNDELLHPVYRDGRAFCLPVKI